MPKEIKNLNITQKIVIKQKKISGQKAQQYYQNNQIKNDKDMDNYVSKKEISSKFDD